MCPSVTGLLSSLSRECCRDSTEDSGLDNFGACKHLDRLFRGTQGSRQNQQGQARKRKRYMRLFLEPLTRLNRLSSTGTACLFRNPTSCELPTWLHRKWAQWPFTTVQAFRHRDRPFSENGQAWVPLHSFVISEGQTRLPVET
jgi:hypothetical protein